MNLKDSIEMKITALIEHQNRVIGFIEGLAVGVGDSPRTNESLRLTALAARDVAAIALQINSKVRDADEDSPKDKSDD